VRYCSKALIVLLIAFWSSAAHPETSATLTASHVRATYAIIKEMTKSELKEKGSLGEVYRRPSKTAEDYLLWADFGYCEWHERFLSSVFTGYKDAFAIHLISGLAINVSRWSRDLQTIGYPANVWKPLIEEFEKSHLEKLTTINFVKLRPKSITPDRHGIFYSKFENEYQEEAQVLASALNDYAEREHKSLPKIFLSGEKCTGAGGQVVTILTDPSAGRVSLIPIFFYKLCRAQGIDPYDRYACDRWREIPRGVSRMVSGDYRYVVDWGDGEQREGTLPFNSKGDGDFRVIVTKNGVRGLR
jgi:hypothetical protein